MPNQNDKENEGRMNEEIESQEYRYKHNIMCLEEKIDYEDYLEKHWKQTDPKGYDEYKKQENEGRMNAEIESQ